MFSIFKRKKVQPKYLLVKKDDGDFTDGDVVTEKYLHFNLNLFNHMFTHEYFVVKNNEKFRGESVKMMNYEIFNDNEFSLHGVLVDMVALEIASMFNFTTDKKLYKASRKEIECILLDVLIKSVYTEYSRTWHDARDEAQRKRACLTLKKDELVSFKPCEDLIYAEPVNTPRNCWSYVEDRKKRRRSSVSTSGSGYLDGGGPSGLEDGENIEGITTTSHSYEEIPSTSRKRRRRLVRSATAGYWQVRPTATGHSNEMPDTTKRLRRVPSRAKGCCFSRYCGFDSNQLSENEKEKLRDQKLKLIKIKNQCLEKMRKLFKKKRRLEEGLSNLTIGNSCEYHSIVSCGRLFHIFLSQ